MNVLFCTAVIMILIVILCRQGDQGPICATMDCIPPLPLEGCP